MKSLTTRFTRLRAGLLLAALSAGCGDDSAQPGAPSGATIVGAYGGTLTLDVVREAVVDTEASVECAAVLRVDEVGREALSGRITAAAPSAGCGEPGDVYAIASGTLGGPGDGMPFELTLSPAPSARLRCSGIIVNTVTGAFFAGSSSGHEVQFDRGFSCTDHEGDWLQAVLSFEGSRQEAGGL